jgi:hypothetical protein
MIWRLTWHDGSTLHSSFVPQTKQRVNADRQIWDERTQRASVRTRCSRRDLIPGQTPLARPWFHSNPSKFHQAAKSRDENSRIHLPACAPTSKTWTALSCIDSTLHSHATNVDTARAENSKEWRRISNISKRVDPCHECFHYHSRSIVHFF